MELKYFKVSDFDCQQTGQNEMKEEFLVKLDALREACGFPFIVTSGYRSINHTIEKNKKTPGTHTQGIAADIKVANGAERYTIVNKAMEMGFTGVGIAKNFVHVDIRDTTPVVWIY